MAEAKSSGGTKTSSGDVVGRGLRILGEAQVAPGASQFIDGNLRSGFLHLGLGIIARSLLGGVGVALVAANSYSQSVTGKGLVGHFGGKK